MFNLKLKGKLLISFFFVTCISTVAVTAFSISYFSAKIRAETLQSMHKHIQVASLIYNNKMNQLRNAAGVLGRDGTFQLLVQLGNTHKLEQYLQDIAQRDGLRHIVVLTPDGTVVGQSGDANLAALTQADYAANPLFRKTRAEMTASAATEHISNVKPAPLLALTAAAPVMSSSRIIRNPAADTSDTPPALAGIVLLRYGLNHNPTLPLEISRLLGLHSAIYHDGAAISSANPPASENMDAANVTQNMPQEGYLSLMRGNLSYQQSDFQSGGILAEYQAISGIDGRPLAVLGVSVSADKYVETVRQGALTLTLITVLCLAGAFAVAYGLARSLLTPINHLLDGVQRVRKKDWSHAVMINARDELGELADSFNDMATQLKDIFSTLEWRVADGTAKLKSALTHLSAIIDNMADGLLVTDEEGKIIRVNPALTAMFPEHKEKEILGHDCHLFGDKLWEQVNLSRRVPFSVHTTEIALSGGKIGQAAVTAILQKDSVGEEGGGRYEGSRNLGAVILIRDVTKEKEHDRVMKNTVETLTRIGSALSAEHDLNRLLEMIVTEACNVSYADGGTLYTVQGNELRFEILRNKSKNMLMGGTSNNPIPFPPFPINASKVSGYCALHKEIINTPDVYQDDQFDFSGVKEYDRANQYHTRAMLVVPLLDRRNETVGVLQLINPVTANGEPAQFEKNQTGIVYALAGQAAVAIENARNYQKIADKNRAFERFVPTEFLRHLGKTEVEDIKLGDAISEYMSVLFSDIRAFTSLSETMSAQDNFHFLNDYLEHIGPEISGNRGFIDKYIGDAIMALFPGSQRKPGDDAVAAAVGMLRKLQLFNREREQEGLPAISIGIGIHTGELTLGTIGFEGRMESTVIGDTVNLASRVESLTKLYGIDICITDSTFKSLTDHAQFAIREVDTVQVKGKECPVTIYEVLDGGLPEIVEERVASLSSYYAALALYKLQHWEDAFNAFSALQNGYRYKDRLTGIYIQRCQAHKEKPPMKELWNGVTRLLEK